MTGVERGPIETAEEYKAAEAKREQAKANLERHAAMQALWRARGSRYAECTFASFKTPHGAKQTTVKDILWRYGKHIGDELKAGTNIVLIGPPGTGKDHLLAALMREAVNKGHTVKWTSGAKLFARLRDDIETRSLESKAVSEYATSDVLTVSDPIWDGQPLTRHQRLRLGEIIDERYNNRQATWVSINAANRSEAEANLGGALVDRLRDGSIVLVCDWPTARKPR